MTAETLERLLIQCAREKRDISYAEALQAMGLRFTRPKMRELCRLLGEVDRVFRERGEPELAALVVRSSDRLPGDGWWTCRKHYHGQWTGDQAAKYLQKVQRSIFQYWECH